MFRFVKKRNRSTKFVNKPPISVKRCVQEIWSLSLHVFVYRMQIQVVIVQNGDVPVPWKTFCGKTISHP